MSRSLHHYYPRSRVVPLLVAVAMGILLYSYTLPFMESEKLFFFTREYSLFRSIERMWDKGFHFLAIILFVFSVIFPLLKLFMVMAVWFKPLTHPTRERFLGLTTDLGKWSMLDVFVVAVLVVVISARSFIAVRPCIGIYLFTGAIILSMVLSAIVKRLAKGVPVIATDVSE
jgi:paraquat-inducible protein A